MKQFDNDFYEKLEYHLTQTFRNSQNKDLNSFWCDGIEPKINIVEELIKEKRIITRAWIGKSGQDEYEMCINFGDKAMEKYFSKESIVDCFPDTSPSDWVKLDVKKGIITLFLL